MSNLFDPSVPTVDELLFAHASIAGHVEDHKKIADELTVHPDEIQDNHDQLLETTHL